MFGGSNLIVFLRMYRLEDVSLPICLYVYNYYAAYILYMKIANWTIQMSGINKEN